MKTKVITGILITLFLASMVAIATPVYATKPETKTEFKGSGEGTLTRILTHTDFSEVKVTEIQGQLMVKDGVVKGEAVLVVRATLSSGEDIRLTVKVKPDTWINYGDPWDVGCGGLGFAIVGIDDTQTKIDCASIRFGISESSGVINIAGGTSLGADDVFRVHGIPVIMFHGKT